MSRSIAILAILAAVLSLSACGERPAARAATGGLAGAVVAGPLGAIVGGTVGAATATN